MINRLITHKGVVEQSAQGKGWLVSFIAHVIIIALLFIPMFMTITPPEEEEGVMVSLGLPDEGQGDEAPSLKESTPQPQPASQPVPVEETKTRKPEKTVASKVVTSNVQSDVTVREAEAKKAEQAAARQKAADDAKKAAAYNNTKK